MSKIFLEVDGSYYYKRTRLGVGIVIREGETIKKFAGVWDTDSTSIKAEYLSLINGLALILGTHACRKLHVTMDCQPVVRQLQGHYNVADHLKPYYSRAIQLLSLFEYEIEHKKRQYLKESDKLSKKL
ncbi:MAG TPA: reverse transcriptase-like protein [Tissierellaceae bacterium]|nr:reverse transcriptase-like protein [Tissierellaceae bacterium]